MQRKKKKHSGIAIALSCIAVYLTYSFFVSLYKDFEVEVQEKNLNKEIKKLKEENDAMKKQLNYITTPSFVEREAKRELNLKKPGEEVLIIKNEDTEIKTTFKEIGYPWEKMSGPERWFHYFAGNRYE